MDSQLTEKDQIRNKGVIGSVKVASLKKTTEK